MRIFPRIECTKNRRVIYSPERIGPVFPTLWGSYNFSYKFVSELVATPQHGKQRSDPFWSIYDPQPLVHSILGNILMNLTNFLGHYNSILLKNISFSCGNTTCTSPMRFHWFLCKMTQRNECFHRDVSFREQLTSLTEYQFSYIIFKFKNTG